ncbi:MAG: Signal transduction histidine kinase [Pelotomaculum thermopropionicum]|uniref:histidine kinase n=1 Tax=Pelotomaculum thermopropionicum TaxID=110500 RepID=A0A117M4H0_9FIRM|nr:MAG: Signal transduction histidine kinase [Pelotomaculum thermopropionicum]
MIGIFQTLKIKKKFFHLRTKIAVLSFGSVLLAILVGGFIVVEKISDTMEKEIGMRAIAIARTMAQYEEIKNNIGKLDGMDKIQPLAERTRLATGVEYIVVVDMKGIRYSHPVEERIGKKFTGSDLGPALANNEYVSRAEGVLGPSVRAFVPVKVDEGTRQVGVVIVGILTPTIGSILRTINVQLYSSLAAGLIVGLLGSLYLAKKIKSAMFSLEPEEIARLLEERVAIFQAMGEGIIAIDNESRVTIANDEALRIIGKSHEEIIGHDVKDVIPHTHLPEVLETGQAQNNFEMFLNNTIVLVNRVPVMYEGEIIGAVSTFQDKTEVNRLAEELTGVKAFVEALRVQNHEHMNKLHTIAGLVQLEKYEQALDYIFDVTEEQQKVTRLLTENIFDSSIAGLLLGKYGRAKELKIDFEIDPGTNLKELPSRLEAGDLVLIIGNLIENAFDAVRYKNSGDRTVYFGMFDNSDQLSIKVSDQGHGIPMAERKKVFKHGFTTKGSENQGLGLYLVKRYIDLAGGSISIKCPKKGGSEFVVYLPKN